MNKRITLALRNKANELSTIKRPEITAKVKTYKIKGAKENDPQFVKRVSLSYAPGTTQQVFNKLKAWFNNLPGEKRSIETINKLKEMPC